MSKTRYVYGLLCPIDLEVKYVGLSVDPENRLSHHMCTKTNKPKKEWIKKLKKNDKKPGIIILEEGVGREMRKKEIGWIVHFRKHSSELFNGGSVESRFDSSLHLRENNVDKTRVNKQQADHKKMTTWENIGKQIKQKRTSQNLTQKELGTKIGASNTYIWKLENQTKKCSVDKLQEIADALDCTLQVTLE